MADETDQAPESTGDADTVPPRNPVNANTPLEIGNTALEEPQQVVLAEREIVIPEPDDAIVVPEPYYPWPAAIARKSHGSSNVKPDRLFHLFLNRLRRVRSEYEWIPMFRDSYGGQNALSRLDPLIESIEALFNDQLQSRFNDAQLALLHEADCVLICFDPKRESIVSYGSARFSRIGDIPGVRVRVTHGGHMIVSASHERNQIAPLTAVTLALYDHTIWQVFQEEIIVLRTNNRFIERLMRRVEPIYRSDQIVDHESDERISQISHAMQWTNRQVYHFQTDLEFGQPIKIAHRFKPEVTISGVAEDEIIYLARMSSLGYFLWQLISGTKSKRKP